MSTFSSVERNQRRMKTSYYNCLSDNSHSFYKKKSNVELQEGVSKSKIKIHYEESDLGIKVQLLLFQKGLFFRK